METLISKPQEPQTEAKETTVTKPDRVILDSHALQLRQLWGDRESPINACQWHCSAEQARELFKRINPDSYGFEFLTSVTQWNFAAPVGDALFEKWLWFLKNPSMITRYGHTGKARTIIICGSRLWQRRDLMRNILLTLAIHPQDSYRIGCAKGADELAQSILTEDKGTKDMIWRAQQEGVPVRFFIN